MEYMDAKTAMGVDRRRRMEEERKQRIFNEKIRTKGLDVDAIEDQIKAKKEQKQKEETRERAIAEEIQNMERQLQILFQRHEEAKKQVVLENMYDNRDLSRFKMNQVVPEQVAMDTTKAGASNMLIFTGEDTEKKERTRYQQQQIISWNEDQIRLRNQRIKAEREAQALYDQQTRIIQQKVSELAKEHERAKASVRIADKEYNKILEQSHKEAEYEAKREEENAAVAQVLTSVVDPLLTEQTVQTSALSATRVIPYAFKGMTPEQKKAIVEEQERQRKEKEEAKKRQEEEERRWVLQQQALQRAALLKEREVQRTKEEMQKRLQSEQMRLAKEKSERYNHLYKNVYTNPPSDEYFNQFNTSSR